MFSLKKQINSFIYAKRLLNWEQSAPVMRFDVRQNLVIYLESQEANYRIVLNKLIECFMKYGMQTFPSHESLAQWTGLCEKTIRKYLGLMKADGIIDSLYRHRRTCLYKISPHLLESKKWWRLTQILPALGAWFKGKLPTINYKRIFNNKAYGYLDKKDSKQTTAYSYLHSSREDIKARDARENIHGTRIGAIIGSLFKKREGKSVENIEIILESVCTDKQSIGLYLTPLALACGKKLNLNCYTLAELLCVPDVVLHAAYASLRIREGQVTNPKAYFFSTVRKVAQEKGIVIDLSKARQVQLKLADHQNHSNDYQYADSYNLPNENPKPVVAPSFGAKHTPPTQSAPGPRKGSWVDGNSILRSNPNWPPYMKLGFLPRGMKYETREGFEKWAQDPMYPWRITPDMGEMLNAGYNLDQIECFLKEEIARWTDAANAQRDAFKYLNIAPTVANLPDERINILKGMLKQILRSENGFEATPKDEQEGIKNDRSETFDW